MAERQQSLLRPVRPADLTALSELRHDAAAQHMLLAHPEPEDSTAVQVWLDRREQEPGGLFRVVDDGAPRGFVQIARVHRRDRWAYAGIALLTTARGQGLGRAAMQELLAEASSMGLRKLLLEVRADNEPALRLYRGLGFRAVGTLAAHYHDGAAWHDVIILERLL